MLKIRLGKIKNIKYLQMQGKFIYSTANYSLETPRKIHETTKSKKRESYKKECKLFELFKTIAQIFCALK